MLRIGAMSRFMNSSGNSSVNFSNKTITRIDAREWAWVFIVAAVIILMSTLPYVFGHYFQTPEKIFNGAVNNRQDYAVYITMMKLGARGEWSNRFMFSSEAPRGAYLRMGYIFLGHVSRVLGLGLELTYHIARVFFGYIACIAIYFLIANCFPELYWRRTAFILAIIGSGLGWIQLMIKWWPEPGISPIDFWFMDPYIFFGLLTFPHFMAVTALISAMLGFSISFISDPAWWKWVLTMLCSLLIQTINPLAVILGDIAVFGAFVVRWWQQGRIIRRDLSFLLTLTFFQMPLLLYNVKVIVSDSTWRKFVDQNVTLSPPIIYYLLGFFIFWPFVWMGIWSFLNQITRTRSLSETYPNLLVEGSVMCWLVLAMFLAYSPVNLQRRFMHAYTLPLAILAIVGLRDILFPWIRKYMPNWIASRSQFIAILIVFFASISSIALVLSSILYLSQRPSNLYDSAHLVRAVDWIGSQADTGDVVLSGELTGQLVASRIGIPVYLGHPIETLCYKQKSADVDEFYKSQSNIDLIRSAGVRWIIHGPSEREIGVISQDKIHLYMQDVYHVGDVTVYKVIQ